MLLDHVQNGDYTISQAKRMAADILFHNSNQLYQLGLNPRYTPITSYVSLSDAQLRSGLPHSLSVFLQLNPNLEYVWINWIDYTSTSRVRIFPIKEFIRIVLKQRRIGVSLSVLSMLQDDTIVPGGNATGQLYFEPDCSSLILNAGMSASTATGTSVMTFWRTEDNKPLEGCPRTALQNIVNRLQTGYGIDVKCGFEIELMLLKPFKNGETTDYAHTTRIHSWSQITADTRQVLPVLEEVHKTLASIGIELQQFHAESSPSQFEFILPPASPLAAVDTLLAARRVVTAVAERHGLRATLHPRPFSNAAGNASHTHLSISKPEHESSFLAGILDHLHSILAFTMPQDVSYERVRSGIWAGSEWVSWGFQNRESPIRKVNPGHWEFRPIDGLANPYLGVAAILASGLLGLDSNLELGMQECTGKTPTIYYPNFSEPILRYIVDASSLTDAERLKLGITQRISLSLSESLKSLEKDELLQGLLGPSLVKHYMNVKKAESSWFHSMGEENLRLWLIERY